MIQNIIKYTKSEIKNILSDIKESKNIMFLSRKEESGKNPHSFFLEIGIDYSDAEDIIRNLEFEDYQYTQYSTKSNFGYMHIFFKEIKNTSAYIKIAFKNDKTIVISFHEKIYD